MHSPTFLFRMQRWSLKEYRHGPVKSTGILVEPPPLPPPPTPITSLPTFLFCMQRWS